MYGIPESVEANRDSGREHWAASYRRQPDQPGPRPTEPGAWAAARFQARGALRVLDLAAGQGRDTLWLARHGFDVIALDASAEAARRVRAHADAIGVGDRVRSAKHDPRDPLPLPDRAVDAVYAPMVLSSALSTAEIVTLVAEVRRVLVVGGMLVYTVRHTGDPRHGAGVARGDDIFEHGGVAVHFFTHSLVDRLAKDWRLDEIFPYEEGEPPRRLWRITQTRPT